MLRFRNHRCPCWDCKIQSRDDKILGLKYERKTCESSKEKYVTRVSAYVKLPKPKVPKFDWRKELSYHSV